MRITAEHFKAATGHEPVQDDLERCNCPKAGQLLHMQCGWNEEQNLPNYMAGIHTQPKLEKNP